MSWDKPTEWMERFVEALELLCAGNRPSDKIVQDWWDDEIDSFDLQEFCIKYCPLTWSMGISVIDAAITLADQPAEGVGHKIRE
jgi:hypothetical protein